MTRVASTINKLPGSDNCEMVIPEKYINAIKSCYPRMEIDSVQLNRDGMNNDVVVVNRTLVCRFPKTEAAKQSLSREIAVSRLLAKTSSIRVPALEQVSDEFVSYEYIDGEPLSRNQLLRFRPKNRQAVLSQLGEFLRQLHSIPPEKARLEGISVSGAQRTREELQLFKDRVESKLFPKMWSHQRQWVNEHFAALESNEVTLNSKMSMIHGDLGCYHLLCDTERETLTGVIDFGTAGIGSQAVDMACLMDTYGESIAGQILEAGMLSDAVVNEARFRAGLLWLEWALNGVENSDFELLIAHVGHSARDILPIGAQRV